MDTTSVIIFIFAVLVAAGVGLLLARARRSDAPQSLLLLQQQISELNRVLDAKLSHIAQESRQVATESTQALERQFSHSAQIIATVTEKLSRLDETNRQVVGFAQQLQNLQDILKNPKQRGILGEYYLETVLKNVLPPGSYQMQYPLGTDERTGKDLIVDAVVFVDQRIIPIDSKFSLENYNRFIESPLGSLERKKYEGAFAGDIKNRIDETAKYVRPEVGTANFAFMFIPSEAIFYDLIVNSVGTLQEETRNLITYAGQQRVIAVSPTSFLAYLQTVLQGLRNQKISEEARQIMKNVEQLGRHLKAYEEYMAKMGRHLGTTVSSYNQAYKELGKIDKDVLKISGEAIAIDVASLEGPHEEENSS